MKKQDENQVPRPSGAGIFPDSLFPKGSFPGGLFMPRQGRKAKAVEAVVVGAVGSISATVTKR